MEQLFFAGKAYLKINSLVKTPSHEFMAVERSGLWAPVSLQYSEMLSISLRFHSLSPDMFCTAFSHAKPPRNIHAAREVTLSRF